jgi:hypothetical protein
MYRQTPKPETDSGSKLSLFRGTPVESGRHKLNETKTTEKKFNKSNSLETGST